MAEFGFGVDLGGTTVKLGLFGVEGNILDKWEIPTRKENQGPLPRRPNRHQDLGTPIDHLSRNGRSHHCRSQRQDPRPRPRQREHGRSQARRIRAYP